MNHLQCASDGSAQDVGILESVIVIRQLHKLSQGIGLEYEREFIVGRGPAGDGGGDVQIHLEPGLHLLRSVSEVCTPAFFSSEAKNLFLTGEMRLVFTWQGSPR